MWCLPIALAGTWIRSHGVSKDGYVWGRGAMDMKGLGMIHLYAFLSLKRAGIPLSRDVIFMAVADEETGGELGARWMIENHYQELDPEYVLDEGGFGSRDLFVDGKLVFGISIAEKKIVWLKVRAEGVAGHGSQPHQQNPNDRLVRALARLLSHPLPSAPVPVLEKLRTELGTLEQNKFTHAIQHSTISLTTLRSGSGRSGEGKRHSVGGGSHARLSTPPRNLDRRVVGGDPKPAG